MHNSTDNILDLIGNTPTMQLKPESVFAKAEFLNPGGSIKDRVALAMIEGAERDGRLNGESIICEPTSGNTGIGVALVGRLKGYRVRIVMPENMSEERKKLLKMLGAELVLTPAEENIKGSVERVRAMADEESRIFVPQQFENPDNAKVHYEKTAAELWQKLDGDIACFVAGVGSGGTLQGVGVFLKEHRRGHRLQLDTFSRHRTGQWAGWVGPTHFRDFRHLLPLCRARPDGAEHRLLHQQGRCRGAGPAPPRRAHLQHQALGALRHHLRQTLPGGVLYLFTGQRQEARHGPGPQPGLASARV